MNFPKTTKTDKIIYVEAFIALTLFIFTLVFSEKEIHISFSVMIGLILYYMIFVELVRSLFDFILDEEHKFKVRYIYDMGIMFLIREILVTMASSHYHIEKEIYFLSISSILLIILFFLRIYDAKVFKYTDKCNNCSFDYKQK